MQNKSEPSSKSLKNTGTKPVQIRPKPDQLDIVKAESEPGKATIQAKKSVSRNEHQLGGVYIISVAARILEMHPQTPSEV